MVFDVDYYAPDLPYLVDQKVKVNESSGAITRYICKKWAPEMLGQTFTEQNALKIIDLQLSELRMAMAADNDLIKEKLEVFENSLLDKDWLAGENITYADLEFFEVLKGIKFAWEKNWEGEIFSNEFQTEFVMIIEYHERVGSLDRLRHYKTAVTVK